MERPILSDLSDDPVLNAMEKFFHHTSVHKIKVARDSSDCFCFKVVTIEGICKEIVGLVNSKATQGNDMHTKIIKNSSDIFSNFFQANLNNAIETATFPDKL